MLFSSLYRLVDVVVVAPTTNVGVGGGFDPTGKPNPSTRTFWISGTLQGSVSDLGMVIGVVEQLSKIKNIAYYRLLHICVGITT